MTPSHKAKDEVNVDEELIEELERLFPKGDKARGKALVLNALAQIKISDLEKERDELRACHEAELGVCQRHCDIVKELEAENKELKLKLKIEKEMVK